MRNRLILHGINLLSLYLSAVVVQKLTIACNGVHEIRNVRIKETMVLRLAPERSTECASETRGARIFVHYKRVPSSPVEETNRRI